MIIKWILCEGTYTIGLIFTQIQKCIIIYINPVYFLHVKTSNLYTFVICLNSLSSRDASKHWNHFHGRIGDASHALEPLL